ncbi:hypothetical protein [Flagellimonas sp.]|uniref:hypothetical protein n=1 Tax=Flagellimonas sp. TaxID=2058762 RepID=UPI003F4A6B57
MEKTNSLIFCLLFIAATLGSAQENKTNKTFTMIYTPGESWNYQIPFNEQLFFAEHSQHLQKLRKNGLIIVGGRYADKGFMLLQARDSVAADSIVKMDLSVKHHIFDVELFEFRPFYYGCIEKHSKQDN